MTNRLRRLGDIKLERIRAEQVSQQVTEDLRNQARLQEANAAEAASRAQEALSLAKEASKLHDLQSLAWQNSSLSSDVRFDSLKLAEVQPGTLWASLALPWLAWAWASLVLAYLGVPNFL